MPVHPVAAEIVGSHGGGGHRGGACRWPPATGAWVAAALHCPLAAGVGLEVERTELVHADDHARASTTPSATTKSASLATLQVENGRSWSTGRDSARHLISRRRSMLNTGG